MFLINTEQLTKIIEQVKRKMIWEDAQVIFGILASMKQVEVKKPENKEQKEQTAEEFLNEKRG